MEASVKAHALCSLFPAMTADEYALLLESVRRGFDPGQPIVVWTVEGIDYILDGRHRHKAALEAGVTPLIADFEGTTLEEAAQFVIDRNLHRRHLSTGQRSMIGAELKKHIEKSKGGDRVANLPPPPATGKSRDIAAKASGVSARSVTTAEKVAAASPELAQKVASGEITLNAAKKALPPPPPPTGKRKDGAGKVVTTPAVVAALDTAPKFKDLINELRAVNRKIRDLAKTPAGAHIRIDQVDLDVKNIVKVIEFAVPYAACPNLPNCVENGCKVCHGSGVVSREIWDRIPAEERE
jgi:hypothetical protein